LEFARQVIPALGRWIKVNVSDKWSGSEILACHEAAIAVTLPKPVTSGIEAKGHFGKQDFRVVAEEDIYVCPARRKARLFVYDARQRNGFATPANVVRSSVSAPPARTAGKKASAIAAEASKFLAEMRRRGLRTGLL
jgi:hypothetical protein